MTNRTRTSQLLARGFARGGGAAFRVAERLANQDGIDQDGMSLEGDRWVEWSFCMARLAQGPGRTLDFGADIGFLSLAAAQRGHDVVAYDRLESSLDYMHPSVTHRRGDILVAPPRSDGPFDQIINCSSVEHVGLGGRYGSPDEPDGDITAMAVLHELLASGGGRMILTIPVGRDLICAPKHRIYGEERLPRLLEAFSVTEEQYWRKDPAAGLWCEADRAAALQERGSDRFYALGLFVLSAR